MKFSEKISESDIKVLRDRETNNEDRDDLDSIRLELAQIRAALNQITEIASGITDEDEADGIGQSLRLIAGTLNRTQNKLDILTSGNRKGGE